MRIAHLLLIGIIFILLTVLTQIGGIIYLFTRSLYPFVSKKFQLKITQYSIKVFIFISIYSLITFLIIPPLAKPFGREPLPLHGNLQPLNFITCFLNRHYVRSELKLITLDVTEKIQRKFPGTKINYLDANFPFINKFPLVPHLSHNDGKKLDLAFFYKDASTGKETHSAPGFFGYGICENPAPGEEDISSFCTSKGHWQYSILQKIMPQWNKNDYTFDSKRTKALIILLAEKSKVEKIFLEPHLKMRMDLTSDKIRFHGCQAVRHDDHIHFQIK